MSDIPPLTTFGERIMICGASATGKSTLAAAIGHRLGLPVVHLDQLRFVPDSDFVDRPEAEYRALHDEAIARDSWIIDGDYSFSWDNRIARATGIIYLSDRTLMSFGRYVRRTLFERNRIGALPGGKDSLKWDVAHWVLFRAPRNVGRHRAALSSCGVPFLELNTFREQERAYAAWDLERGLGGAGA
jgi:adenylate kinase family enzyme